MRMKSELVYGLMQLQVFDTLKNQNTKLNSHTVGEVCRLIMILELRMKAYVKLLGTKDELELKALADIKQCIRGIGDELNSYGGFELMYACCELVSYSSVEDNYEDYLNRIWNGIGGWLA